MSKKKASPGIVKVIGTSPLSFELRPGTVLTVKEFGPASKTRPSIGSKFKSNAYLLFNGITKIGRLSPSTLSKLGGEIPTSCKVVEVDKARKVLLIDITQ
jgi:hypothetical protein